MESWFGGEVVAQLAVGVVAGIIATLIVQRFSEWWATLGGGEGRPSLFPGSEINLKCHLRAARTLGKLAHESDFFRHTVVRHHLIVGLNLGGLATAIAINAEYQKRLGFVAVIWGKKGREFVEYNLPDFERPPWILVVDTKLKSGENLKFVRDHLIDRYTSDSVEPQIAFAVVVASDDYPNWADNARPWIRSSTEGFKLPGDNHADHQVFVSFRTPTLAQMHKIREVTRWE